MEIIPSSGNEILLIVSQFGTGELPRVFRKVSEISRKDIFIAGLVCRLLFDWAVKPFLVVIILFCILDGDGGLREHPSW